MQVYLDELAINDPENGYFLDDEVTGLTGLPTIRSSQGTNTGRDGGWVSRQLYDARLITFTGRLFSTDKTTAEERRKALAVVLARKEITLKVVTYGGFTYSAKVNVMGFDSPISFNMNLYHYKLDLRMNNPIWYDASDGELVGTVIKGVQGGFTINFGIPFKISGSSGDTILANNGNASVYPRITITTPATNPKIINKTTGKSIQVNVSVNTGDKLEIDMAQKTVLLNGSNVFNLIEDGSVFFPLVVGDNAMALETAVGSEATTANVYYNSGFISI